MGVRALVNRHTVINMLIFFGLLGQESTPPVSNNIFLAAADTFMQYAVSGQEYYFGNTIGQMWSWAFTQDSAASGLTGDELDHFEGAQALYLTQII